MTSGRVVAACVAIAIGLSGFGKAAGAQVTNVGANSFDLLLQFSGRASGGDGSPAYRRVDRAMAVKSILDARDEGFTFLRIAAAGYGPSWPDDPLHNDLARWLADPDAYWADVDAMFDTLDQAHMRLVPSLLWNIAQFPALTSETEADLVGNPKSRSRLLALRYIHEFITRYHSRPTILFYEIGNEFNLLADLDQVGRCTIQFGIRQFCAATGNFSTAELIGFSRDLVAQIRQLDPTRGVSSGYSTPRPAAAHLARRPQFGRGGADWTLDGPAEFKDYMRALNAPFQIVSLHIYPGGDNVRPSLAAAKDADMVDVVAAMFHPLGKKIYVGEFGDRGGSHIIGDIVGEARRHSADYASVWAWEFYQSSTHPAFAPEGQDYAIGPGYGDGSLRAAMRTAPTAHPIPRIVLTWPLPCANVDKSIDLFAVASLGATAHVRVSFFLDGKPIGMAAQAAYHIRLDPSGLGCRLATLEARGYGGDGAFARFTSDVGVNGFKGACTVGP